MYIGLYTCVIHVHVHVHICMGCFNVGGGGGGGGILRASTIFHFLMRGYKLMFTKLRCTILSLKLSVLLVNELVNVAK